MDLSDIQGRYPVQPQIRILLFVLGLFLPYLLLFQGFGYRGLGVILSCVAAGVISFITKTKPYEKAELEYSTIEKQIDGTTVILHYILSFFIPLAGFIVGAIYASKDEEHYKHVGKNCLIFSVMNIVLGFIMIALLFS
ncbi:MAG: hypothetical protein QF482_05785 [Candidatus Poseidoniia archaeon]|nr:hypothetical protein [Candidatus Poseidoniia archaeon]